MRTASYPLRMPSDLKEWIAGLAKKSDRSMNGQIVAMLRERATQIENAQPAVTGQALIEQ